eukprot:745789-Alexandrium_andersonii.AAC.1
MSAISTSRRMFALVTSSIALFARVAGPWVDRTEGSADRSAPVAWTGPTISAGRFSRNLGELTTDGEEAGVPGGGTPT